MPLFWFTGKWAVGHDDLNNLDVIRIEAYYRNALPSGDYPYPFWHSADKWSAYEAANELRFYISDDRIVAVTRGAAVARQRVGRMREPAGMFRRQLPVDRCERPVAAARLSLFSANFSPADPVLPALDAAYRDFAMTIRQGTCLSCHTPANRAQMDHLVLLQTPMHASGEIDDALKMVSQGDMPRDDIGNRKPLDPQGARGDPEDWCDVPRHSGAGEEVGGRAPAAVAAAAAARVSGRQLPNRAGRPRYIVDREKSFRSATPAA